ncbi:MAG: hypothetical protein AAGC63_03460 [Propionicimonas sp.]|nr:hypothetical protein [Propionicimonas sp.]
MSVVVLTSAGHAPGVTTTALGLALCWPRPVLLVDADPHPTQSILAGHLQGEDPFGKGLWAVLAAHRERRGVAAAIEGAALGLSSADGVDRRYLPGYSNPGMVELFASAWPEFAAALAARPDDVLVDAGRLGNAGLPGALQEAADLVLAVTGSSLVDLAALRLYLPLLTGPDASRQVRLLIVGPGRPYSAGEISAQFQAELAEPVPWAPAEARAWSHGAAPGRGFPGGGYVRGVRRTATTLTDELDDLRQRIGAPR